MKKTLIALTILAVMFVSACATRSVTFEWDQAQSDIQSGMFRSWKLWGRIGENDTWKLITEIPYVEGRNTYTQTIGMDTKPIWKQFTAKAYCTDGTESDYSNIVEYDMENPKKIKIKEIISQYTPWPSEHIRFTLNVIK